MLSFSADADMHFGLGKEASEKEISAWNIDVRPDGSGLPSTEGGNAIQGKNLYQQHCQFCHGLAGQGGAYDQLVGRLENDSFPFAEHHPPVNTIGNYWPWATTLFDYIRRAMPYTRPGSLSDDEVYSLTAYILYENKIIPEDMMLTAHNLPTIEMPSQRRFVPDNRTETQALR
ncbi:cytochrome c [uncultured Endozoicomonas sp.]|uniref:c-type cytochrome n=1 Tax=uncultured Endozoicomonas sp. TaxID=432652 RepID=UPI002623DF7B|nr:cytochrome c [uncultured Endozoicomonas sp.]